jgi:phosphocarrier protein HPr
MKWYKIGNTNCGVHKKGAVCYMKERKIKLVSIADAKAFVTAAMKCDFDVDVFYNRVVIDGKSILGVLSMDLTKTLNVRLHGENKEFEEFLETLVPVDEKIA